MKMQNHFRMGRLIHKKMAVNDIWLNKFLFMWGNLAPDLCFSYIYRLHTRAASAHKLEKLLDQLYKGELTVESMRFSYYLGVMSHYLCDFFCYPHTPVFKGGLREHYLYEDKQTVNANDMPPFYMQKSMGLSRAKLIDMLDWYIINHEQSLAQNAKTANADIPLAMYASAWAISAVYLNLAYNTADNYADEVIGGAFVGKM